MSMHIQVFKMTEERRRLIQQQQAKLKQKQKLTTKL